MLKIRRLFLFITLACLITITVQASNKAEENRLVEKVLTVAVTDFKPTVIKNDDGSMSGFEIELFEAAAQRLGWKYVYKDADFITRFEFLRNHQADIAISGSTITAERESSGLDFSHRDLDSGLRIMVPKKANSHILDISYLKELLSTLTHPDVLRAFSVLLIFSLMAGVVFVLYEYRHCHPEFHGRPFLFNLVNAFYWAITVCATVGFGDLIPKKIWGKIIAIFTMLIGIQLFSNYTSTLSSVKITKELRGSITQPSDLSGKKVATVANTTSVEALRNLGAKIETRPRIEDTYDLLTNGDVDAVVFDSPPLMYYAQQEGADKIMLVGPLFERQDYGFAFPEGSPLREQLNRALLQLEKNGFYEHLHKKYFGE